MELTVLIDVLMEKFGMFQALHVFAQPDNFGMDTLALFVQTEKHGTLTLINANVQSVLPGMV